MDSRTGCGAKGALPSRRVLTVGSASESKSVHECPFCSPPADRVFLEADSVIALWDGYPISPGHALVVPRRHVAGWFEASRDEQIAIVDALESVKAAIVEAYAPDGYNIWLNSGRAAGQTVFHLHVHVIPRYNDDVEDPRGGVRWVIPDRAAYWE